jgi:hypothetical protein
MTEVPGRPKAKKLLQGKDSAGHEFAGEVGLTERIAPPRPAPAPQKSAPAAKPPFQRAAPDPSIAGSKYFTPGPPSEPGAPRTMSSVQRERSKDTEALDSTIEEDLGEVTRRRERERAAQGPSADDSAVRASSPGPSHSHRELDAEARPRELDFSAPDMPRKRRQ